MLKWIFIFTLMTLNLLAYRRYIPISGLKRIELTDLEKVASFTKQAQILDIRDYMEYERGHFRGAINISRGRLSIYWERQLFPEQPLILIADRKTEAFLASRFLRRKGFRHITYVLYINEIGTGSGGTIHSIGMASNDYPNA